jgi:hypothetical protein
LHPCRAARVVLSIPLTPLSLMTAKKCATKSTCHPILSLQTVEDQRDPFAAPAVKSGHVRNLSFNQERRSQADWTRNDVDGDSIASSSCSSFATASFHPKPPQSALTQASPLQVTSRWSCDEEEREVRRPERRKNVGCGPLPTTPKSGSTIFEDWIVVQAQFCDSDTGLLDHQTSLQTPRKWNALDRITDRITRAGCDQEASQAGRAEELNILKQQMSSMESFVRRLGRRSRLKGPSSIRESYDEESKGWQASPSCAIKSPMTLLPPTTPKVSRPHPQTPAFFALSCDQPFPRETTSARYYYEGKQNVLCGRKDTNGRRGLARRKALLSGVLLLLCIAGAVAMIVVGTRHSI